MLSYFYSFTHPFQFARFLSTENHGRFENLEEWREMGIRSFSAWEGILLAWSVKIFSACIVLFIFQAGDIFTFADESLGIYANSSWMVLWLGFGVISFPLRVGVSFAIWKFAIRTFSLPFVPEEELERNLDNALAHSTSSYLVCAIPFFGNLVQEGIWALYLFSGLKNIYRLSSGQAVSIISMFTVFIMLSMICTIFALNLIFKFV